jgi:hypothetical protein
VCLVLCSVSLCARNSALLVGVGNYNTAATGWPVIHGNNDVELLLPRLSADCFDVRTLVDSEATKANIMSALRSIASGASSGDVVYIHFSGHGQQVQDMNRDEDDDFDESFVCYDACFSAQYSVGAGKYRGQNHLIDDELFPVFNQIKRKIGAGGELIVVFDSCYSGGAERGETEDDPDPDSEVDWNDTCRGSADEFRANKSAETYLRRIARPDTYVSSGGHMTVISACQSDKRNYECRDRKSLKCYGSLSYCISRLLDRGIAFSQWGDFFVNKKYVPMKIFRPSQHPVVEQY